MKKDKDLRLIDVGYDDNLSLAEAQTRLGTIVEIVEDIRIKYAKPAVDGYSHTEQIEITPEDTALLYQCFGQLLPLSAQPSVQEEFNNTDTNGRADTLFAKVEVLIYVSWVFNSGVTLLGPSGPPRRINRTIGLV